MKLHRHNKTLFCMILHTSRTFFPFFPPSELRPSKTPPALPTSGAGRISIMLTADWWGGLRFRNLETAWGRSDGGDGWCLLSIDLRRGLYKLNKFPTPAASIFFIPDRSFRFLDALSHLYKKVRRFVRPLVCSFIRQNHATAWDRIVGSMGLVFQHHRWHAETDLRWPVMVNHVLTSIL